MPKQPATSSNIYPRDYDKEVFQAMFRGAVRDGSIQLMTQGQPFTLVMTDGFAVISDWAQISMQPLEAPIPHPDAASRRANKVFTHQFQWEEDKKNPHQKDTLNLMAFFDDNMDILMQALDGVREVPPSLIVSHAKSPEPLVKATNAKAPR